LIVKAPPAIALIKARTIGTLLISDEIAAEYVRVFSKEKFNKYVPLYYRLSFIENIISNAIPVAITMPISACRDPLDDKFLSLAVAGKATCIISGDNDLLVLHPFRYIPILRPNDFLAIN
jgi:putative PIN family toxin of toxin-antitoxin system